MIEAISYRREARNKVMIDCGLRVMEIRSLTVAWTTLSQPLIGLPYDEVSLLKEGRNFSDFVLTKLVDDNFLIREQLI